MKKSVLLVLPWDLELQGGVNRVVGKLVYELDLQACFRAILFVGNYSRIFFAWVERDGYDEIHGRQPIITSRHSPLLVLAKFAVQLPLFLLQLHRLVRRENLVAINVHYPSTSAVAFCLYRRFVQRNVRLVLSFHGTDLVDLTESEGFKRRVWEFMLSSADTVTNCSRFSERKLESLDCYESIASKLIPNGVDPAELEEEARSSCELPDGLKEKEFLISIGTFLPVKGHKYLVEAFSAIAGDDPTINLVLVGGAGPTGEEVQRMVRDYDLQDRVFIYEDLEHGRAMALLARARLFVLSSVRESDPIVVLEAGALGVPVVATRVGSVPELLESESLGVVVAPNSSTALEEGIRQALRSADDGQRLRSKVLGSRTWRASFESYLREYSAA